MRELILRAAAIMAEIDEIHGSGTAARDAGMTFAVLAAGCCLAVLVFVAAGG